jgi:hypothetical protein
MRCPDCGKTIGRFEATNPPRCPLTGRFIPFETHWHKSELAWWRPSVV